MIQNKERWFHGTIAKFNDWDFPPPPKDNLTVRHNALFFTTNLKFAKSIGPNVAQITLTPSANLLNTLTDLQASDQLRANLAKLAFPSLLINTQENYWHAGWKSGEVLRMLPTKQAMAWLEKDIQNTMKNWQMIRKHAEIFVYQNATRRFIDQICCEASALGYSVLKGNEIDRHTNLKAPCSQPWLAVMDKKSLTSPNWIEI